MVFESLIDKHAGTLLAAVIFILSHLVVAARAIWTGQRNSEDLRILNRRITRLEKTVWEMRAREIIERKCDHDENESENP